MQEEDVLKRKNNEYNADREDFVKGIVEKKGFNNLIFAQIHIT